MSDQTQKSDDSTVIKSVERQIEKKVDSIVSDPQPKSEAELEEVVNGLNDPSCDMPSEAALENLEMYESMGIEPSMSDIEDKLDGDETQVQILRLLAAEGFRMAVFNRASEELTFVTSVEDLPPSVKREVERLKSDYGRFDEGWRLLENSKAAQEMRDDLNRVEYRVYVKEMEELVSEYPLCGAEILDLDFHCDDPHCAE